MNETQQAHNETEGRDIPTVLPHALTEGEWLIGHYVRSGDPGYLSEAFAAEYELIAAKRFYGGRS